MQSFPMFSRDESNLAQHTYNVGPTYNVRRTFAVRSGTAKKKLERLQFSTSSSFVKI